MTPQADPVLQIGSHPDDQTLVVTGASSGIGAAIAQLMAQQGRHVLTVQRRPPTFLGPLGQGSVDFLEADLSDANTVTEVSAHIAQRFEVGYLVNNAGVNRPGSIDSVTQDDLDAVWCLNVKAPIALIQAVLPGGLVDLGASSTCLLVRFWARPSALHTLLPKGPWLR